MFRRQTPPPEFRGYEPVEIIDRPSNLRPLAAVCIFLSAAIIGLLLVPTERAKPVKPDVLSAVRPALDSPMEVSADTQRPVEVADAEGVDAEMLPVTRANTTLIGAPILREDKDVSRLLQRPIRASSRNMRPIDVGAATQAALESLGVSDPRLNRILVQALANGQSNAFIDALLNAEVERGSFPVPDVLSNGNGGFDTTKVLLAILEEAGV